MKSIILLLLTMIVAQVYASEEKCEAPLLFSPEIESLGEVVQNLNNTNDCHTINEVSELNLESFKNSRKTKDLGLRLLKIFVGDREGKKKIDQFDMCGKKAGSDKFVSNLILVEAANACLVPAPPGLVDMEEAQKIAITIGSEYKDMSLFALNSKKDEITKKAVTSLLDAAMEKQISVLLPDKEAREDVIKNIKVLSELHRTNPKTIVDFAKYKFGQEAPFEVAEKILPYAIQDKFKERLPISWSKTEKKAYLEQVSIKISDNLKECLAPFKQRIGVGLPYKDALALRKKLEADFCSVHPEICDSNDCNQKVNLFSLEKAPTDTQRIQACMLQTIEVTVEQLTGTVIISELDNFKEAGLTAETKLTISTAGQAQFKSCMQALATDYYNITPESYTKNIEVCSTKVKSLVTKEVARQTLYNMGVFPESEKEREVTQVLAIGLEPCLDKIKDHPEKSTTVCIPLIEISAAEKILERELNKMETETSARGLSAATQTFKNCIEKARKKALSIIPEDASAILDLELLSCSKDAILKFSEKIAEHRYHETIKANTKEIKDLKYSFSLRNEVASEVRNCFKEQLEQIKTWDAFKAFNSAAGFTILKEKCTQNATSLALSKILPHEAGLELNKHVNNGLLKSPDTASLVLANVISDLGVGPTQKMDIRSLEQGLQQAYKQKMYENPYLTTSEFISEFKEKAKSEALSQVHSNLIEQVNLPGVDLALTAQCLENIVTRFQNDLKPADGTAPDNILKMIADLLSNGLNYRKQKAVQEYDRALDDFKLMCKNVANYSSLWKFLGDPRLEFLFKASIQKQLIQNFTHAAEETYKNDLERIKGHKDEKILIKFVENQYLEMKNLISSKLLDPKAFEEWISKTDIIQKLKLDMSNMIVGSPEATHAMSEHVVASLFKTNEVGSFASEFTRIQLSSSLGLSGLEKARVLVNENMKDLKIYQMPAEAKIRLESHESLNRLWNPAIIKQDLDWDGLPSADRNKLIQEMYVHAVLPEANKQAPNLVAIEKSFLGTLEKGRDKNNKTFNEKFPERLKQDVSKSVGKMDVVKGVGWSLLKSGANFPIPLGIYRFYTPSETELKSKESSKK